MSKSLNYEGAAQTRRISVHLAKYGTNKDDRNVVKPSGGRNTKEGIDPLLEGGDRVLRKWQRKGRMTHLQFCLFFPSKKSNLLTASVEVLRANEDNRYLLSPEVSNPSYTSSPITCH